MITAVLMLLQLEHQGASEKYDQLVIVPVPEMVRVPVPSNVQVRLSPQVPRATVAASASGKMVNTQTKSKQRQSDVKRKRFIIFRPF